MHDAVALEKLWTRSESLPPHCHPQSHKITLGMSDSSSDEGPQVDLRGKTSKGPQKVFHKGKWRTMRPKQEVSTSDIKKKIRDAQRTLKRPNLNATTQVDLQRRIQALQQELEQAETQKKTVEKRRKNYEKYKFVRFMERQKITRRIKQVKKDLEITKGKEKRELEKELQQLEINLNYTLHYPVAYKYVSLFQTASDALRDVIRNQVAEMLSVSDTIKAQELEERVRGQLGEKMHAHHVDEAKAAGDNPSQALLLDKPRTKPDAKSHVKHVKQKSKIQQKKVKDAVKHSLVDDDFFMSGQ